MKSGVILTAAGLAGIAVLVGQMYADAQPHREASTTQRFADPGGVAGGTPDLIVCIVSGIGEYGTVGGISAYAIGTTSQNNSTGGLWLSWRDTAPNANQHPVIAQNLFRLKDGRFEQIGISWLKHGFCAADSNICGSCANAAGCDWLGVGCADTYGSNLNGNQSLLGPRFEVNPVTGFFPFPHTTPTGNSTLRGRMQVEINDVNPALNPGAVYFVESQYITPDDAGTVTANNNNSYRPASVGALYDPPGGSGLAWDLTTTGSTHQQDPAIQAWQDQDPSVSLVNIDVANDGRFILGYKVTDLGGGTWHYEYALNNMNSDRAAGSFSVPIPACVTVTNEGFHDVFYHSGEPYDGTDWPVTVGGGDVSWSTDDFTANPDANALRWGTMYNYRFDADSPPTPATLEIGLFKTGAPVSVSASAVGPTARTLSPDITGPFGVPDGCVDAFDLGAMFGAWCSGVNDPNPPSPPCENCNPALLCLVDISGPVDGVPDGCVDAFDLAKLLAAWCSVAGGNPCGTCSP
ncbi:MAG: hypothetical protein IH830_13520 [Planctomycetes bacterium]|nr:hypothetical protein [Planctomycetota bacterium]